MRPLYILILLCGLAGTALAAPPANKAMKSKDQQLQVSAEDTLEYYQDKKLYVARGKAKAIRGEMTVTADVMTAHERDKPNGAQKKAAKDAGDKNGVGDIDVMTAEGHVVIVEPKQRITGDHAVYDLNSHKMIVTGNNLRYETAKEVVTSHESMEYYEDTKLAIARGHAVADQPTRRVSGDVLTAEFRDAPNGQSQLTKMTAQGHVTVLTKPKDDEANAKGGDVTRGERAVYDAGANMAVVTGDVKITRKDGTQLYGDVGEVNFNTNQNRLMNSDGNGRVQALLPAKATAKATGTDAPAAGASQ